AVKAALDEGIVPGGGITLINLSLELTEKYRQAKSDDAIKLLQGTGAITGDPGVDILIKSLHQPFITLLNNAGLNPAGYAEKVMRNPGQGIDVNTGELVDLKKAGIIDPARVTKEAIQNAVSIAGTAITMGALVVDVPKEEKADPAAGMGGMGGMGGMM
ncbi:MAG TPA: TCP-1/cpn60 chaperonin family protein, partial [Candidatus Saccharimonadales bacterium]